MANHVSQDPQHQRTGLDMLDTEAAPSYTILTVILALRDPNQEGTPLKSVSPLPNGQCDAMAILQEHHQPCMDGWPRLYTSVCESPRAKGRT